MEVNAELTELESWRRRLAVRVPEAEVAEAFLQTTRAYAARTEVPGFRKGKAPLKMVGSRHAESIKQDVLQELLPQSYEEALKQHSLVPMGDPEVSEVEFQEGQDLRYIVEIDIRPEVEIVGFKGMPLVKTKFVISDGDVNKAIDRIRTARADVVTASRPAERGDIVTVDLQKLHDSKNKVKDDKIPDLPIELTEGCRPEFLKEIPGMRVGEGKEIEVNYSNEESNPDLAGNTVLYRIWLKSVGQRVLPDLNDEFVKSLGPFDSVDSFRGEVRKDLEVRLQRQTDDDLRSAARKKIIENNAFEVPKRMVDNYIQGVMGRMQESNPDVTEESIRSVFEPMAIEQFRWDFIVMEIAKKEELHVSSEEVAAARVHIEQQRRTDDEPRPTDERLANSIIEQKVLQLMVNNADITEQEQPLTPKVITPGSAGSA